MTTKLICEHQRGWLDRLQQEVAAIHDSDSKLNVFALIDCVFNERCHTQIHRLSVPSRTLYDLSANPSSSLQAVSPTLVPLTLSTAEEWREVLRLTDGWPMLSLIVTPESLDDMASRLHPWCIVNADGQPFVFRFPDTRRLPAIVDVLAPDQHGALFGPAVAWRYRTRSAQWEDLPLPKNPEPIAENVRLDAEQCARLISDSEADSLISSMRLHEPALMHSHTPATAYELVATSLDRADFYGLGGNDRASWCRLVMQHPQLVQLPAAAALLAAVLRKERSYADITNDLSQLAQA